VIFPLDVICIAKSEEVITIVSYGTFSILATGA
jgi:hypothetical protein